MEKLFQKFYFYVFKLLLHILGRRRCSGSFYAASNNPKQKWTKINFRLMILIYKLEALKLQHLKKTLSFKSFVSSKLMLKH